LKKDLLDKVFLDVKGSLTEKEYIRATGVMGYASRVRESLQASMESGIPLDVRTTIFPAMPDASEIAAIAETLFELKSEFPKNGLEAMVFQQGRPRDRETTFEPVPLEILNSMAESIADLVNVQVRAASNANGKSR
jgi:pyruvate formate lyase activating enzyme